MTAALLDVDGLLLCAGARELVRDLRWRVEPGQRWALLGRNGSGKSTLLRCLAGLQPAAAGSIRLQGRELTDWDPRQLAGWRALLPALPADRFSLDVLDSVLLVQPRPDVEAARRWLDQVDATALIHADLLRLSSGERQRVALAQTLAQQAALLLLDEPASFQDPGHQQQMAALLGAQAGCAQIIAAHDLNWVTRVATHVLALRGDGGWQVGPASAMLQPELLREVYRCDWRRLDDADGGYWIAG